MTDKEKWDAAHTPDLELAARIAKEKVNLVACELELRLGKWFSSSQKMEWRQVKSSARYAVGKIGSDWVLQQDSNDKYVRMFIRLELERLVRSITRHWHKNPTRVWHAFKRYCLEMATASLAKEVIDKMRA